VTTTPHAQIIVDPANWSDAEKREEMFAIRTEVFVREQNVPEDEELDGRDPVCLHVIARSPEGRAIGTARMQRDGHIGRIAVRASWRGQSVGSQLVLALLAVARDAGLSTAELDSQVQAIGFYEKLGFVARGEPFMDAGIPHRNMVLSLAAGNG
jgi:predicted GNAT family N-acyltransferase